MNILKIFAKSKRKSVDGTFADFFLHASEKEKKRVFTDAARRANEDQRILVQHIDVLKKETT